MGVLQAGEVLGLRSLQDYCSQLKGSRQAALGIYSFADVQRANASGKVGCNCKLVCCSLLPAPHSMSVMERLGEKFSTGVQISL